jgi:hypothetical protein
MGFGIIKYQKKYKQELIYGKKCIQNINIFYGIEKLPEIL